MTPMIRRLRIIPLFILIFLLASAGVLPAQAQTTPIEEAVREINDAVRGNGQSDDGNRGRGNNNGNGQENQRNEDPVPPMAPPEEPVVPEEPVPEEPVPVPEPEVPVTTPEPEPLTPATINRPVVTPAPTVSGPTLVASAGTIEAAQSAIFPYARNSRSPLAPEVLALAIAGMAALARGFSLVRRESITVATA